MNIEEIAQKGVSLAFERKMKLQEVVEINFQFSEYIISNPEEKARLINLIISDVSKTVKTLIEPFYSKGEHIHELIAWIKDVKKQFEQAQDNIKGMFCILSDQRRLRVGISFEKELKKCWGESVIKELEKTDIIEWLKKQLKEIKEKDKNYPFAIGELIYFLKEVISWQFGEKVREKLNEYIRNDFNNDFNEARQSGEYIKKINELMKKENKVLQTLLKEDEVTLRKEMNNKFVFIEEVIYGLKKYFEHSDIHGIKQSLQLLHLVSLKEDIINSFKSLCNSGSKQYIKKLFDCFKEFNAEKVCETIMIFDEIQSDSIYGESIISGLKEGIASSDCLLKNGDTIHVIMTKYAFQIIDNFNETKIIQFMKTLILLPSRDIFESLFWKTLYGKIVSGKIKSIDTINVFVNYLKQYFGTSTVSRISSLIQDYITSLELVKQFKEKNTSNVEQKIKFDIVVFGLPQHEINSIVHLPPSLDAIFQPFKQFYLEKFPSRRISIEPEHSLCVVSFSFNNKTLLYCTTIQYCILYHFHSKYECCIEELSKSIENRTFLLQVCDNLVAHGLLIKTEDTYKINNNYQPQHTVTNITKLIKTTPQMKLLDINEDVEQKRSIQLQCSIIKIMKRERQKLISNLINEVVIEVSNSFTPTILMIKKSIEYLIQKEYLKRNENNSSMIVYLA
ncbi:cullin family protein [Entamoeba histolytica HM-1:IMSS-B]|uniref:Cullin, putative n=6 Tax=Entamoeba histolytica TaxID=5759 RepID=C4M9N4_ENTH1|nr:cullin, putative [Entamoeba histolytica HM-1:IMSS]EMD45931.1 cullin, putative [Entamoeba histolytica KU27]EMH76040.1 cullin family protein [Entamoeba histolytica HM-1:IMSS-B]EMS16481.1 cullin, putative [Entamoeba histolytica HM-3:IMSS]ENY65974.1 cullin, putative [Entamoeba histolytica HM-1:IMSS-A]GAT98398.1 cullin family protein [Entamoeba histolytica]|eukprot:XP_652153.2 cullin, putative [Entamoeba histolytica HM-1:IMSS]